MKSILVAEGDELVAELFAYLFAREGWSVTMYRDGQPAAAPLGGSAASLGFARSTTAKRCPS